VVEGEYQVTMDREELSFRTSSFSAERSSVLHAGVYTREFSSMLLASAICMMFYMLFVYLWYMSVLQYLLLTALFVVIFLSSRQFIFIEKELEVVFSQSKKHAEMIMNGIFRRRLEDVPFDNIISVETGTETFVPENIDGIKFVQKISAQHGSAMPDMDRPEVFATMYLNLKDGTKRTIYAGKTGRDLMTPAEQINNFLHCRG
jgi:Ca2+/Na+ antiporter